jgi:peroxiredoxin
MSYFFIFGLIFGLAAIAPCCWLCWQLVQQNGRMLLRIEALEKRIEEKAERQQQTAERDQGAAANNGDERAERFSEHSLANSKINRDGLKAGTAAPEFRLPRLDGGELALSQLRGRPVLLVFSSPHCGPCNALAPKLQKFHRKHAVLELVMISRESLDENRAKAKEHGLTFPVVLQEQWEVSRAYAYFATPVAYLIDPAGVIVSDVAVGVDAIAKLMKHAKLMLARNEKGKVWGLVRRVASWQPS